MKPRYLPIICVAALLMMSVGAGSARTGGAKPRGHIFILMVWDGLRPDLVDEAATPRLAAMLREGTNFAHHHSAFPTVTTVNGGVLATGAPPGTTGILGNSMYFAPALAGIDASAAANFAAPLELEHTPVLEMLNGPRFFAGKLLGASSVAQEIERVGGYVAIVGKQGPTFLFDDRALDPAAHPDPAKFMFVAGDQVGDLTLGDTAAVAVRDTFYIRLVIDRALPAAKIAAASGRPALIVVWQHNPDATQHMAGLGTQPALDALRNCDANLGLLRDAIARTAIANDTNLMVVSDHGFATIREAVAVGDLLVTAGLKKAPDSDDVVIARNGGNDLVYVSPRAFADDEARRAILARIVDFAAAQDWSGPLFTHAGPPAGSSAGDTNLGWIPGTFSQDLIGIHHPARSPDLVVTFRELSDVDNRDLTGPSKRAFALGLGGQRPVENRSMPLLHPIAGVMYADNAGNRFTTGMGMHGAAGTREVHNFCAARGPAFKRGFVDSDPSGNIDVAPTIRTILGLPPTPEATGRVLDEALAGASIGEARPRESTATSYLVIQGGSIVTRLKFTHFASHDYLDDSSVTHNPIGPPQ
jgi:arylsulfatase A-like enzyme